MNTYRLLILPAAVLAITSGAIAQTEEPPPSKFRGIEGDYTKNGRVEVRGAQGIAARGKVRMLRVFVGKDGRGARFSARGELVVNGATRTFRNMVALRRDGTASISNLAPGIEDGRAARDGTYQIAGRTLNVEFDFVLGTTAGRATLSVRRRGPKERQRLFVTQTLKTDALLSTVTWKFRAAR
jgi:hypothetical protein